jgi:dihydropteroate synthase
MRQAHATGSRRHNAAAAGKDPNHAGTTNAVFNPRTLRLGRGMQIELGPDLTDHGDSKRHAGFVFGWGPPCCHRRGRCRGTRMMVTEGADIIDIGGESTRPGADPVNALEEQRRIMPVIEELSGDAGTLISVDTWRAETARLALSAGAHMINDVWGLQREPEIARIAAGQGAAVAIMHTGRGREVLD